MHNTFSQRVKGAHLIIMQTHSSNVHLSSGEFIGNHYLLIEIGHERHVEFALPTSLLLKTPFLLQDSKPKLKFTVKYPCAVFGIYISSLVLHPCGLMGLL